jgi:hypothetical protein
MATTYTLIDKSILGANQNSVSFSSIPSTYTDLLVKFSVRTGRSNIAEQTNIRFNDDGDGSYSVIKLAGDGGSAFTEGGTYSYGYVSFSPGSSSTSNTFGNAELYIPNYLSSNNKSYSVDGVMENNASTAYAGLFAGLWAKTAAINKISFYNAQGNDFLQYSSFYLYGIKNS